LIVSDAATYDYFGASVTITSDGLITMVGADLKDTDDFSSNR